MAFFIRDKNVVFCGFTEFGNNVCVSTDVITPRSASVIVTAFTTRHDAQMELYNIAAIDSEHQWAISNNLDYQL